ncbi:MAG: alpha/beta fold hydrolase [bacterium]
MAGWSGKGDVFQRINGHFVNTASFGSGGVPFIGVSGSFGTWEIWRQPFELLSRERRTIGFDHLGAGDTRVPPELVTFENQVQLVAGVFDSFEIDRCVLAGDSSMASVAIEAAVRWPDRVKALVLVSAGLDFGPTETVLAFLRGLRGTFDSTVDGFVRACLPEDETGDLRRWLARIIAHTGGERAAQLVEMFFDVDVRPRLGEVSQPTLVVHGALDVIPTSRLQNAQEIADTIPNATLEVLPDAGHVPTLSRADAVTELINGLLASPT